MKVNLRTGEVCLSGLDLYVAGFVPIEVTRQYSSTRKRQGSFGSHWSCSLDVELFPASNGWNLQDASGEMVAVTATRDERDPWQIAGEQLPFFERLSSTQVAVYTTHRLRMSFSLLEGRFRPQRIEDRHGNGLEFRYRNGQVASIRDDFRRQLQVTYNAAGLVSQLAITWDVPRPQHVLVAEYEYDREQALTKVTDALGQAWTYEYAGPLVVRVQNPKGGAEYAAYDRQSRCVANWRSDSSRSRFFQYDDLRRATLVRNSLGHQWLYVYGENGQMIKRLDPLGGVRETHYDLAGGVLAHTGAGADGMSVINREEGRTEITHANGASTVVMRAPNGQPLSLIDAGGNQWLWQYESNQNVLRRVSPSGGVTTFHSERGFLTALQLPNGAIFQQRLDQVDGTIKMSDSEGAVGKLEFDLRGQLISITDGGARRVELERDLLGRVCRAVSSDGWYLKFTHDALGNVTSLERSDGSREYFDYDSFGRIIRHVDPAGAELQLLQGPEDRLLEVRLPNGRSHRYEYDPLDRVVAQVFSDGREERYVYDERGELAAISAGMADLIRLEYDPVGLVEKKEVSGGAATEFSYDPLRRLVAAAADELGIAFEFDSEGNCSAETQQGRRLEYTYDSVGNCTAWQTELAPAVRYEYDLRGRLVRLIDEELGTFHFQYTAFNELALVEYPDSTVLRYAYDSLGLLTSQELVREGIVRWSRKYERDVRGRPTRIATSGRIVRYQFDPADRLLSVEGGSITESYSYDPADDISTINGKTVLYDSQGRVVQFGDTTLRYDSRGFPDLLICGSTAYEMSWDGEGRFRQCRVDGERVIKAQFDCSARLLELQDQEEHRSFVWCGALLYLELQGPRLARRYLYHPQLLFPLAESAATKRFFVPDENGRVAASFGESPHVEHYEYSALGELRTPLNADDSHPFRLPGQYAFSGLPFKFHRFRLYLTELGRFLTPDPLGIEAGVNLYQYPTNPILCVDLIGLCDGEVFYRAMSDAELQALMKNCQLSNRPESESACHEAFVTQRKDYSQKLQKQAKDPSHYPNLVEFCCSHGTASALQNPAISAASNSAQATAMFPNHSRTVKGLTNIIHLKFEQVTSKRDRALNYGLRRGSIGTFNDRVKSAKAQPGGQSCTGPGK